MTIIFRPNSSEDIRSTVEPTDNVLQPKNERADSVTKERVLLTKERLYRVVSADQKEKVRILPYNLTNERLYFDVTV